MIDTVTQQQIDDYQENGFVVIDGMFNPAELEAWRGGVHDAVEARGTERILGHDNSGVDEENFYNSVFIQRVNLWQDNQKMRDLILDARLGKIATDLAQTDGMRIWHDQTLIKPPWANQTSFHLDNPYWSFSSRDSITIWIALDDVTVQNGCLYFLPGTHKRATYDNTGIGPNLGELFTVYPDWASIKPKAVEMKAGSASFHNGLTAHAAGPNMTPGFRRAMTCGYMPQGSTFNGKQNILTQEQFESYTIGDVLDDDEHNPLLFSHSSATRFASA